MNTTSDCVLFEELLVFANDFLEFMIQTRLCRHKCWLGYGCNRTLEQRALEKEFFPMEEVLHEKVKSH
jgi:hypothetical protein